MRSCKKKRSPYFPRLMGTCTISYRDKREGDEKNKVKLNTFVAILVPYSRPLSIYGLIHMYLNIQTHLMCNQ
jgi:hypothetical protein